MQSSINQCLNLKYHLNARLPPDGHSLATGRMYIATGQILPATGWIHTATRRDRIVHHNTQLYTIYLTQ